MPKREGEGERCTLPLPNYTAAMNIMKVLLLFFFSFRLAKKSLTGHLIVVTTKCITSLDSVQAHVLTVCAYTVPVIITNKH